MAAMAKQRTTRRRVSKRDAERAAATIQAFWRSGKRSCQDNPRTLPRDWTEQANRSEQETLRSARRVARAFSAADISRLRKLMVRHRCALSVSHVVRLCSIEKDTDRLSLLHEAVAQRWSKRQLDAEIKKRHGKRTTGGRIVKPESVEDACVQIIDLCDRWDRLCQQLETVAMHGRKPMLHQLSEALQQAIAAANEELIDVSKSADRSLKVRRRRSKG